MAEDYLTAYREFFEHFAKTVNPEDQLPVKLSCYKLLNVEVVGGVIDWTTQYLTQKNCPPHLIGVLIKIVIDEIRKFCKKQPIHCGFNPSNNAYEPLKLMQTVMAKVNEVCLRYLDNSMLSSLPPPGAPYFITSAAAMRNSRKKMEDRHTIVNDLGQMFGNIQEATPSSYYAIFDGHAGQDAADYSSAHLHQYLVENMYFLSDPTRALKDAFCKTDALFREKCRVENLSSGTTALCALLRPEEKRLYVAWAGDSLGILVRPNEIVQCVNPHKPGRPDEKKRIEADGGLVIYWGTFRVNGQLAVSRAIGDPSYKPFVTAEPDVYECILDGSEHFLILGCDGLWDHVSEYEATTTIYDLLFENAEDTERVSKHLVQLAKQSGSLDNITVIVVFLKDPAKIVAEAHRANHNGQFKLITPFANTMDAASLDNANNPFAASNGTDNSAHQTDDLLLHLTTTTGAFKQNGADLDDYGPETDVDAVDDGFVENKLVEGLEKMNNNPEQRKTALELAQELQKQQTSEFDDFQPREDTPTPPADAVHDVSGLDVGESDSEDEWDYIKGDEANKGAKPNLKVNLQQPENPVAGSTEDDDNMSQLNPNAAEFVPVSPTRSIPSPVCRQLLHDDIISQSPVRQSLKDMDVNVPAPIDFDNEIKSCPSDLDNGYKNGHDAGDNSPGLMENLLNGKNIEDIREFQPGSTPTKQDDFHFGLHAIPFTPVKLLDQSEAALSTRAVFGDDTAATIDDSTVISDATVNFLSTKESDPMSMSFYDGKEGDNPFDLNAVHLLPDNVDDFLKNGTDETAHKDDDIETTDLDRLEKEDGALVADKNHYEEKELASPVSQDDLSDICPLPKTPEAPHLTNDVLVEPVQDLINNLETVDICERPTSLTDVPDNSALLHLELDKSPICDISESKSPLSELDIPMSPEPALQALSPDPQPTSPGLDLSPQPEVLSPEPVKVLSPEPQEEAAVLSPEPQQQQEELQALSPEPIVQAQEEEQILSPEVPQVASPEPPQQVLSPEPQPLSPEVQVLASEPQDSDLGSPIEEEKHDICKLDKPIESPHEDITSSVKDDVSSPTSPEPPVLQEPVAQEVPEPEAVPEVCSLADRLVNLDLQPAGEPFVVQTENIAPEFAEPAIVATPSESSEAAPVAESPLIEAPVVEAPIEVPIVAPIVEEPKVEAKPAEKEASTSSKAKPAAVKKSPAGKPLASASPKTSPRVGPKTPTTAAAKTASPKPPVARIAPLAAKSSVPKATSSTLAAKKPLTKPAEKKPLTNGDVKAPTRPPTLLRKKPATEGAAKPAATSSRPLTATRTSPTKAPIGAVRPSTAPKTTAPRPASTLTKTVPSTASKTGASLTSIRSTTTTTKSALSKPASAPVPKAAAAAPKPRVPLASSTLTKPRVPLTKTVAKAAPDAEKQNKESANKLTASRVTTTTRTTGGPSSSTTTRRVELTKNIGSRTTVTKTTTTTTSTATTKSSSPKKPAAITRKQITTKTTDVKTQNGHHAPPPEATATTVEEQITIVKNILNNDIGGNMVKPTSPIDNKLIVDAPIIEANAAD